MARRRRDGALVWRLRVCALLVGGWFSLIAVRVIDLQVLQQDAYRARADDQQEETVELGSHRGTLYDRHHHPLAISTERGSVYAHPQWVDDPRAAARALAPLLDLDRKRLERQLRQKKSFVFLKRKVSLDAAREAAAVDHDGVGFLIENQRVYPRARLASHTVGFVGMDNDGLAGIEFALDEVIGGRAGRALVVRDGRKQQVGQQVPVRPGVPGRDVVLTLDEVVQYTAERELARGVRDSGARSGVVVMVEPDTGAVLAMASYPSFDPNAFGKSSADEQRNRAVHSCYEPGSILKVITAAAALESGVIDLDEELDVAGGTLRVGSRLVKDVSRHDRLTFADVITYSSNIGMVEAMHRIEPTYLRGALAQFGFGQRTGIELAGEHRGILHPVERWKEDSRVSLAMGYEVCVTPLQMASALAALGNGGVLHPPYLVEALGAADGTLESQPRPDSRRVLSAATAERMRATLEKVVESGTAQSARVSGYRIAGKTGTAKKLDDSGRYVEDRVVASFVGLAPARDPEIAIVVMVDEPTKGEWGGEVAAPIFARIALPTLRHLGVTPDSGLLTVYRGQPAPTSEPRSGWSGVPMERAVAAMGR